MNKYIALLLLLIPFCCIAEEQPDRCARVVTLAPSISEVLFSLHRGSSIVAVSDFDSFPPEVRNLPRVGGLFNGSAEQILSHEPSLVIGLQEHAEQLETIHRFGISTAKVDHRTVEGILNSIRIIGDICHAQQEAAVQVKKLTDSMNDIRLQAQKQPSVRALIVIDRDISSQKLSSLYASGSDGFYNDLLRMAGGVNVVESKTIALPTFSLEGILALNPDVIIEMDARADPSISNEALLASWNQYPQLRAVSDKKVYIVRDDFSEIPGPRFIELLKKFYVLLHHV